MMWAGIVLVKGVLGALFSSDYQDALFWPFIQHFLQTFDNPWQYVWQNSLAWEFPYPPFMLFIHALFLWPVKAFSLQSPFWVNLGFTLPTLMADIGILILLNKLYPNRKLGVAVFYFLSPIILYASYIHSQLDLIPTALLFWSVFLLIRRKPIGSSLVFGLAAATKLHVVAAFPLLFIYAAKEYGWTRAIRYWLYAAVPFIFFCLPYLLSEGFWHLVLNNSKQGLLLTAVVQLGELKLYLVLVLACLLYARFALYKKVNGDLLFAYLAIIFAMFVLLIPPAPAWYVWLFPYMSIFFLKNALDRWLTTFVATSFSAAYLGYFLFFHTDVLREVIFLGNEVPFLHPSVGKYAAFSLLSATLLALVGYFYKFGVRSNRVYRRQQAVAIGIGGDSGAGKTTLLADLFAIFGDRLLRIEGDGDHKWERGDKNWNEITHLNPKANFLHNQAEHIVALKSGKPIFRREYDHHTGTFTNAKRIEPKEIIVLSGLHPFYLPKMRKVLDIKIFLDTDENLRQQWKVRRDQKERGYSPQKVLEQLKAREGDSQKYIQAQKNYADMVIRYFSPDLKGKSSSEKFHTQLQVTLDASVALEELLEELQLQGSQVEWDYLDDLSNQVVTFKSTIDERKLMSVAQKIVPNIDEIIGQSASFSSGFRGYVQLLLALLVSDRMRDVSYEV